jgi:hypothetical protein
MRKMKYKLEIILPSDGAADLEQMERLLDLHFQDLVFDDEFIAALDEQQSVTIRVSPLDLAEAGIGQQKG